MAKGRKPLAERRMEVKFNCPEELIAEVEFYLMDPTSGKPSYGSRSQLITALLRMWLERVKKRGAAGATGLQYAKEGTGALDMVKKEFATADGTCAGNGPAAGE